MWFAAKSKSQLNHRNYLLCLQTYTDTFIGLRFDKIQFSFVKIIYNKTGNPNTRTVRNLNPEVFCT